MLQTTAIFELGTVLAEAISTMKPYQPKTGQPCTCKPGFHRDNCPQCEGTGQLVDFALIRSKPIQPGSFRVLWWDGITRRHTLLECIGINHSTPEDAADAARRYGIESFRVVDELGNRAEL